MKRNLGILFAAILIVLPVSAFALVTCRDTVNGCTLDQLVQLNSDAVALGLATEERIQIMQELVVKLTAQIAVLQTIGSSSTPRATCLDIRNDLYIGKSDSTTNGEVSKLQGFLIEAGVYPEALITGYYGSLTANAVVRWQKAHGMDFVTTSSGVGTMTRDKMKCTSPSSSLVQKVTWTIFPANPTITDENDYRKYEQAISVNATFSDGTTKTYSAGKAYGCAAEGSVASTQNDKKILGQVNCYMALVGASFTAYTQNGKFIVERGDESAKDGSVVKTVVLEI